MTPQHPKAIDLNSIHLPSTDDEVLMLRQSLGEQYQRAESAENTLSTVREVLDSVGRSQNNLHTYATNPFDDSLYSLPMSGHDIPIRDAIRCLRVALADCDSKLKAALTRAKSAEDRAGRLRAYVAADQDMDMTDEETSLAKAEHLAAILTHHDLDTPNGETR